MNIGDGATLGDGAEKAIPPRVICPRRIRNMPTRWTFVISARQLGVALCLFCAASLACADENPPTDVNYRLLEGLQIPGTGLSVGGYATGSYDDPSDAPPRLAIDNLSLFIWWEGDGRWKFFSELEYDNLLFTRSTVKGNNGYLSLERLYLDYALTDTTDIRLGKFLTPVGRWNLIHATPLVWTSSRPLVTTLVFPTNMTGVMVTGTVPNLANGVEYSVYGAHGGDLRTNPSIDPFSSAIGAHVTVPLLAGSELGFSLADFEQENTRPERKQLLGMDFVWTRNRYEFSAEAVYRFSAFGNAWDEKGGFAQLVVPLSEKLYAVGRYETFRTALDSHTTQLTVTGLNYRITPAVVLKAEWVGSKHNTVGAPDGFLSSISILL